MKTFPKCLLSAKDQTSEFEEIIVVDRFSPDGLAAFARDNGAKLIQSWSNRSEARNIGLKQTSAEGVLFVDADMILPRQLARDCGIALETSDALIIPEESSGTGYWSQCKRAERKLYVGDIKMEAARCFNKAKLVALGGYRSDLEAGEDWDLQRRVLASKMIVGRVPSTIIHDEGQLSLSSLILKKYSYGKSFAKYLTANPAAKVDQANPFRRVLTPGIRTLTANPKLAIGMTIMKSLEFASASFGLLAGINE